LETGTLLLNSWRGEILFFAMHSNDLNEANLAPITSNSLAGLPISVPVPPNDEFIFIGNEDGHSQEYVAEVRIDFGGEFISDGLN